ncbi:hypothetical protein LguiB_026442 [Lonicera macranthoides]
MGHNGSYCVHVKFHNQDVREKIITVLPGSDLLRSKSSTSSMSSCCYKNKKPSEANLLGQNLLLISAWN